MRKKTPAPVIAASAAHARAVRLGTPEEAADARAALAAAKIEDFIQREVAKAPPLSDEQRARCARLLLGGGGR